MSYSPGIASRLLTAAELIIAGLMFPCCSPAAAQEPAFSVTITVLDEETNEPVSDFSVVPAPHSSRSSAITWQRQYQQQMTATGNTFFMKRGWPDTVLRIEAEGYASSVTKRLPRQPGQKLTVRLKKDLGIAGVVLSPSGEPAADATVALCTWGREVTVENGAIRCGRGHQPVQTDAEGRFHLPSEPDEWVLVVAHQSGYLERTQEELASSSTITLQKWGHLKGRLVIGGQPVANQKIDLGSGRGDVDVVLHYSGSATTNAQGRFQVRRLPPVQLYVSPMFQFDETAAKVLHFSGLMKIKSGEATEVTIPRIGQTITGRLQLPKDLDGQELIVTLSCILRPPRITLRHSGPDSSWSVYHQLMRSPFGEAFRRDDIPVREDGTFEISGLPETSYTLQARARRRSDPADARPIAFGTKTVTLKVKSAASASQDIGDLVLRKR